MNSPLRTALLLNGAFSGTSGFTLMMFAPALNDRMGTSAYVGEVVLVAVGGALALYAIPLFALAMQVRIPAAGAKVAIALDAGWVLGSVLLLAWASALTGTGQALITLVALAVGGFALAQWRGLALEAEAGPAEGPVAGGRTTPGRVTRVIAGSWLSLKTWVKIWLFALNVLFLASLAFLGEGEAATWILVGYVGSGPFLVVFMVTQRGLSRILGLAHIVPWSPLLLYLCVRLIADSALGPRVLLSEQPVFYAYLSVLAGAVGICLVFDYIDVIRWFRGETYLMGSRAAFDRGASGLARSVRP